MRFSGVLACLSLGAISLALADPPAAAPAPSTAAPSSEAPAGTPPERAAAATSTPATQALAVPPATAAKIEHAAKHSHDDRLWTADPYEEHFLAEGYKMELHNDEKMFCRKEELPGTRIGKGKVCWSFEQLKTTENGARDQVGRWQQVSTTPKHH